MVRKTLWAVAAVVASLLLLGGAASAQEPTTTYGPEPGPQIDDTSVLAGDVVNISGSCEPNADVSVSLLGEVLATTTTDGSGAFSVAVQVPSDLAPGSYTFVVQCGDEVFEVAFEVLADGAVNPPGTSGGSGPLSRTGTDLSTPVAIGVGLVALGGVALALTASRRRQTA